MASVMTQQEALEPLTCLPAAVRRVLVRLRQIANRFVGRLGDPHGGQLAGTRARGHLQAGAGVGLDTAA